MFIFTKNDFFNKYNAEHDGFNGYRRFVACEKSISISKKLAPNPKQRHQTLTTIKKKTI